MADLRAQEDREGLERQAAPPKLRALGNKGVRSSQYRRTDSGDLGKEDVNTQPSEGNSQGHRRSSLDCSSHCRCIQDASRMIGVGGVTFTATETNGDKMRRVGDACVASQVDLRGVLRALRTSGRRQRREEESVRASTEGGESELGPCGMMRNGFGEDGGMGRIRKMQSCFRAGSSAPGWAGPGHQSRG